MLVEIAVFVGLYACVAFIFTKHPQIIHGSPKQKFRAPHIAHRGGAAERPENTLAAFEHAVHDCKTDMLELDCHLTKDEKVSASQLQALV
jgi:hypothetical protein